MEYMENLLNKLKDNIMSTHLFERMKHTDVKNVELTFTQDNEVVVHVNGKYFSTYDLN